MNGHIILLDDEYKHHGIQCAEGINLDSNHDTKNKKLVGRFHIYKYPNYLSVLHGYVFIAQVEIPVDANILQKKDVTKSDKVVISNIKRITDLTEWQDRYFQLEAVKSNGCNITYINNPSQIVQQAAIIQQYHALQYIESPSMEVQLEAVKYSGYAVMYIKNPSAEVQLAAVEHNCFSIQHIANPPIEVQLEAIRQDSRAIQYIKNPPEEVQLAAINQSSYNIEYIANPTDRVKFIAVEKNGGNIRFIENPSEELQIMAIRRYGYNIRFIKKPTKKVQFVAVDNLPYSITDIDKPSIESIKCAIRKSPNLRIISRVICVSINIHLMAIGMRMDDMGYFIKLV